jgi:hypothetical protein
MEVIFPVAGLVIALVLAFMLRSLIAPLYVMASVVLGFGATLGASVLAFQGAGGGAGLRFTIPIVVYVFVASMGSDYAILMIWRLREEQAAGNPTRDAGPARRPSDGTGRDVRGADARWFVRGADGLAVAGPDRVCCGARRDPRFARDGPRARAVTDRAARAQGVLARRGQPGPGHHVGNRGDVRPAAAVPWPPLRDALIVTKGQLLQVRHSCLSYGSHCQSIRAVSEVAHFHRPRRRDTPGVDWPRPGVDWATLASLDESTSPGTSLSSS